MPTEIKCPKCEIWNKDSDYCSNCKHPLSPEIIENNRELEREARRTSILPSRTEIFLKNRKGSRYFLLRLIYQILYTIAFIFIAIASFFAYLTATPNG